MIAQHSKCSGFLRMQAEIAPFLLLIGFVPGLAAQQYCVSGAVTSVLNCTGCIFSVGDPVAMTFSVQPSSVTCVPAAHCVANAAFSADIGARHWTSQSDPDPNASAVTFVFYGVLLNTTTITMGGPGTLSSSSPLDPNRILISNLSVISYPGDLISSGTLPASLPSPDAVAASNATVQFFASPSPGPTAFFSYKGQSCATGSPLLPPTINAGGVVPLYSSSTTIQPGSWVSIFGSNLAAAATTWNGDFPTSLGGTSVTIDGKPAYLWYVSPSQINLQAPDDPASGTVNVVVMTAAGSVTSTVTLGQFGPSFNLLDGKHVAGIILRSDASGAYGGGTYDIVGPTGTSLGYKTVAAKSGDVLELFGIGFGPTNPTVPAGKAYSGAAATTNPVSLSINNVTVTPSFAGITSAGLYQINVTLPAAVGTGDVPLHAVVGGVQTPSGVMLSVQ
jgi:uncharacterized protein (TIGR03437 family)